MHSGKLWSVLSFALVVACGGGGSRGGDPPPGGDEVVTFSGINRENPGGIWVGTLRSALTSEVTQILGAVTESGEARFVTDDGSQLFGDFPMAGKTVITALTGIAATGTAWLDASTVASFSINGTVIERSTFSGTYSGAGDRGTFALRFDPIYFRDSSLGNVEGTWVELDESLNIFATFVIDADGTINGNDVDGCVYAGSVSILDSQFNVYDLAVQAANCSGPSNLLNGSYDGLGILSDVVPNSGANDLFTIGVDRSDAVITLELSRL